MTEPYKCGTCGFSGINNLHLMYGPNGVIVHCRRCDREVEAPSMAQAYEAISKKPEPEGGK